MRAYLENIDRLRNIAEDIVEHYTREIMVNGFKAQVVASSILAAARYEYLIKEAIDKKIQKEEAKPESEKELVFGPNIKDWPEMIEMPDNILMVAASVIHDEVTTTDELIPSGDTSSYRSNPLKLAEYTLSRKDPGYVPFAKKIQISEKQRQNGEDISE